jgi:hypothetical protein
MKKKIILFVLIQTIWAAGFSQSLSLQNLGDTFQRTNLEVRWDAPTNALPHTVWIYRLLPRTFSPEAISNLVALGGFTGKDITKSNANEVVYKSAGKHPAKQLAVSRGSIEYLHSINYGPTNLAEDVPEMSQMQELTIKFLSKLGISLSDIERTTNGTPNFHFWEPFKEYYLPDKTITNVEFRAVDFRRSIDGAAFIGGGTGGDGEIEFGEYGNIVKIDLSWRNLERYKSYPTVTRETTVEWIREGKAVYLGVPMNLGDIDWPTVKSLTIKKAELCYYAGDRLAPSDWLIPLVSLWTTVDTGHGNINVEIDCPIIDETEP